MRFFVQFAANQNRLILSVMIIVMTLLGFLRRSILIIIIEVAFTCLHWFEHLCESKSGLNISQQTFSIWIGLKRSVCLFHLCKWRSVAGYLRLGSCLGDSLCSEIYRRIQIILGCTHTDCGINVFFLAVKLPLSIHWESSIDKLCKTALLQMKRIPIIRKHFKVAKEIIKCYKKPTCLCKVRYF